MYSSVLGTLGLPAFHAILTDERTKDIPLILETASFERPAEVWGVEIGVLNALSELGQAVELGVDSGGVGVGVGEMEKVEEEGERDVEREMGERDCGEGEGDVGRAVREVVRRVSKEVERGKRAKESVKAKGVKAKGAKRRKVGEDVGEDADEDGDEDD
ncbi:hypothetical protein D9611_014082 [Ephemerocybe angulata]|uniref:Uncharacterized protein n=1 Tax=Ephemerocybe angulata TaxID=980116 RepID=A0A8H5F0J7_9AGAR|nr:hypothetical protein D9611_014082 [Tulosesus angulatus]